MKKKLPEIKFNNILNPTSTFDIVKIEDLLQQDLDHDISKNHIVKFFVIFFVIKGQGCHSIDFVDYDYDEGTVLLIRKDQVHKFFRNSETKGYLLIFTEEFIISYLNNVEALRTIQFFHDLLSFPKIDINNKEDFLDFIILIKHLEFEYNLKDDFSIGITRSALHIIISKLYRIKSKTGYIVKEKKYMPQFLEFQKLVEQDCLKSRNVQYYADKLVVSTKTLNTISNDIVNISAKKFINERVIMQIKRLLISTNYSIKEIAYISGFSEQANFFKYFKKNTGSSPEMFRQAH